ncbi:MAG: Ig-like domain-containing protein [Lachnospiraceae bacterium]|nr:Ig-like domain-containing protein [Lachnospiraceae bacterium]
MVMVFVLQPATRAYAMASVPRNTSDDNNNVKQNKYYSDWHYWSQGASQYGMMGSYGCHIVAYAKLLMDSGCNVPAGFNPDVLYKWAKNTKLNGRPYVYANMNESNVAGKAMLPVKYAETLNSELELMGQTSIKGLSDAQTNEKIMKYINNGYYVIVGGSYHFTYIARDESLKRGTAVVSESLSCSVSSKLLVEYLKYNTCWTHPEYTVMYYYKGSDAIGVTRTPTPTPLPVSYGTVKLGTSSSNCPETLTLNVGDSVKLGFYGAKNYNTSTDSQTIEWKSANSKIVSIQPNGRVDALKAGNCMINFSVTVKATNTIYSSSIMVNVGYPATPTPTPNVPQEIAITLTNDSSEFNMTEGETYDLNSLNVGQLIQSSGNLSVTWKSISDDVISIDENNLMTALKSGVCYIKCNIVDNSNGKKYEGKLWVNVLKATPKIILSRMDTMYEVIDYLMENAEYDERVIPDYQYDSVPELLAKGVTDVKELETRTSAIVAVPVTWNVDQVEEILNSDFVAGYTGDALKFLKRGRVVVKKDERYYYVFLDLH